MDRNAAITVARALIEEMGIQPGELFPAPEATAPATDIDAIFPRKRWVPAADEVYLYLNIYGDAIADEWDGDGFDGRLLKMGNVFPTREAAEEHAANIRAWMELRERSDHPMKAVTGYFVKASGPENWVLPGVRFSSPELRDAAVAHIGQDCINALARWIWNL